MELERKSEIFYCRIRPSVKSLLTRAAEQDGFTNMSDWFEQYVTKRLAEQVQERGGSDEVKKGSKKVGVQRRFR